jgi:hypothetical protein
MTRSPRPSRTAELAALGPFFAAMSHVGGRAAPSDDWRSMGELTDGGPVLPDRVSAVRAHLAAAGGRPAEAVELRVAASVAHLGLVARILSPTLALAALRNEVPPARLRLADLHWQPVLGGPFPLSLPEYPARPCDAAAGSVLTVGTVNPAGGGSGVDTVNPAGGGSGVDTSDPSGGEPSLHTPDPQAAAPADPVADALVRHLLDGPVRELVDAFSGFRVSPHILWGNTASALNGATGMLAAARPQDADRVRSLADRLLDRPPLRDTSTGSVAGPGGRTAGPARPFRRRSCCLIYRAAPGGRGGLCGDCVLTRS